MKYEFHLPLTIFYLLDDDNDIFESKWNKMTYFKMLGFFFFFFFMGNFELYSKKIKKEHHVKELAQKSKDSLSFIQGNHLCQRHILLISGLVYCPFS